jgi:hypothetical protein
MQNLFAIVRRVVGSGRILMVFAIVRRVVGSGSILIVKGRGEWQSIMVDSNETKAKHSFRCGDDTQTNV